MSARCLHSKVESSPVCCDTVMSNVDHDTIMCSISAVLFAPCPLRYHDTSAKWYLSPLPARSKQDTFPRSDIKTSNKMWHVAFLLFSTKISTRDCHVASTLLSFPKFHALNTCLGTTRSINTSTPKWKRQHFYPLLYHKNVILRKLCACLPSSKTDVAFCHVDRHLLFV